MKSVGHEYLRHLANQTWHCISGMVAPATGLPYDDSDKAEFTSVSNVGLYLTDVVAARHLGLTTKEDADHRIDRALHALTHLRTWNGFQQCWNSAEDYGPSPFDPWISLIDSGNLSAGILTVAESDHKFKKQCLDLFHAMNWKAFYKDSDELLIGGYNMVTQQLNHKWHIDLLASDNELAAFFAVATGGAPEEAWAKLKRTSETRDGFSFFGPGWEGGGLFMQYLPGIWLDHDDTALARSAKNFAAWQIDHAKKIGSPVWGWSACDDPEGGYLGWGHLKESVVTPHASVLAVQHFPQEVIANLGALEKLGCRSESDGFYDAVDWKSGRVLNRFLMLDQSMLFLSLVNFLDKDFIRRTFQKSPVVKRGRSLIPEYRK